MLKIDGVPQLFFRAPNSEEFNTPGPRLAEATAYEKKFYMATCWSFSPDGQLIAIGSGFEKKSGILMFVEVASVSGM